MIANDLQDAHGVLLTCQLNVEAANLKAEKGR